MLTDDVPPSSMTQSRKSYTTESVKTAFLRLYDVYVQASVLARGLWIEGASGSAS